MCESEPAKALFGYCAQKFPEGLVGKPNAIPMKIGNNELSLLIFNETEGKVSICLFLEGRKYARKSIVIFEDGRFSEDISGSIPEFDLSDREPDFSDITNEEILESILAQLEEQGMSKDSIVQLRSKKLEKIIKRIASDEHGELIVKGGVPGEGEIGTEEISLFDPESGGDNGDIAKEVMIALHLYNKRFTQKQLLQHITEEAREQFQEGNINAEELEAEKRRYNATIVNMLRGKLIEINPKGEVETRIAWK